MQPELDAISVIVAAFAPIVGKRILDVGCGTGALLRLLSVRGARVVGVEPNDKVLALARRAAPEGAFHPAGAEALPFVDRSFDGAVFLNSLHHVPEPDMDRALREAARVVKPAGPIVVIEPLAEGPFFSALRSVEDETAVRAAAQDALEGSVRDGTFEPVGRVEYLRREHFADLEQFLVRIVLADPARAAAVEERRSEVESAFRRHARVAADGRLVLEQPVRARVLSTRA